MSSWWRKVQQGLRNPSYFKRTASDSAACVQKKYGDAVREKADDLRRVLNKSTSDYGRRAREIPARLRARRAGLGKRTQERTEEIASSLAKKASERARALPSKAAGAAKQVAIGAATAGTKVAKDAASATTRAAADAARRASSRAWDAFPEIGSYASWTGRRVAYLILGTAFLYGVGSSLPGAVGRYYIERDHRRDVERRRKGAHEAGEEKADEAEGGGAADALSSKTRAEEAAAEPSLLISLVDKLLGKR